MALRSRFRALFSRDEHDPHSILSSQAVQKSQSRQTQNEQTQAGISTASRASSTVFASAHNPPCRHSVSNLTDATFASPIHGSAILAGAQGFQIHGGSFNAHTTTNVYGGQNGLEILLRHTAPTALHNARDRFDPPKCDEDTRMEVINEIMAWIEDKTTRTRILCMTGAAGAGKSALEQAIADRCSKQNTLAASFFFSSTDSSRDNEMRLISTIAYQIAQSNGDARPFIMQAVEKDPSIFGQSLETQINVLLVNPLRHISLGRSAAGSTWPHAILIDGLDECRGEEHQAHVLRVIHTAIIDNNLPFRIFLTSRPEYAIRTALSKTGHLHGIAYHIILDNKYHPNADIQRFLSRRLRDIGQKSNDPRASSMYWPSPKDIDKLVDRSSGQFIYAATVVKFVSERRCSPVDLLSLVITWEPGSKKSKNPFATLDALYTNILTSAQQAFQPFTDDDLAIIRLLRKLECNSGLNVLENDDYLRLQAGETERMLSDLHSLVHFPHDNVPQFYHKSLIDFLNDADRCGKLAITRATIATELFLISLSHIQDADTDSASLGIIKNQSNAQIVDADINNSISTPQTSNMDIKLKTSLYRWTLFLRNSTFNDDVLDALDELYDSGKWKLLERVSASLALGSEAEEPFWWADWLSDLTSAIDQIREKHGRFPGERWQWHMDNFYQFKTTIEAKVRTTYQHTFANLAAS